jgi:hypothetical protein
MGWSGMTRHQITALLRQLISDEQAIAFTEGGNMEAPEGTQELLHYLDRAVDTYSERRATENDSRLLERLVLVNGQKLPDNFIRFAGNVPVDVTGEVVSFYGDMTTLWVKYYARLPHISTFEAEAEMPFRLEECRYLAALAAAYALNKHDFNVSQDLALLGLGGGAGADSQQ